MTTTRFVNLDALRGLAALSVCLFHFTTGHTTQLPNDHPVRLWGWYGHLGVYVFFTLSAIVVPYAMYVQSYNWTQAGRFLSKRFLRLEPSYLFSVSLALLLNYIAARSSSYTGLLFYTDTKTIASNAAHLAGLLHYRWIAVVFWTLAIEWQFYVLIIILYPLFVTPNRYIFWVTLLAINIPGYFFKDDQLWSSYASYFSIGLLAFRYLINRISTLTLFLGVLLVAVQISWCFTLGQAIAAVLPVLALFVPPIKFYPVSFLATISYSLYLTHLLTGYKLLKLTRRYATTADISLSLIAVAVGFSLGFAYLEYRLVELPTQTISSRITYGNSNIV